MLYRTRVVRAFTVPAVVQVTPQLHREQTADPERDQLHADHFDGLPLRSDRTALENTVPRFSNDKRVDLRKGLRW